MILAVAEVFLLQLAPAMAADSPHTADVADRMPQVQRRLDDLKARLNLEPWQNEAWAIWSAGASEFALQRLTQKQAWLEKRKALTRPVQEGTTPERMARSIERLRARTAILQENLDRLEAAQVRTSVFYDQLDTNQKTIFDLYASQMRGRFGHTHHHLGPSGDCSED
jgi:phage shock protein A